MSVQPTPHLRFLISQVALRYLDPSSHHPMSIVSHDYTVVSECALKEYAPNRGRKIGRG